MFVIRRETSVSKIPTLYIRCFSLGAPMFTTKAEEAQKYDSKNAALRDMSRITVATDTVKYSIVDECELSDIVSQ